jgi:spermidine synthase
LEFALKDNPPITIYDDDARFYLANLPATQKFDLIVGDAFNDFSVPYHLTTREFDELVKAHLKPNGIYMVNIIDLPAYGHFFRAYVNTLREVFTTVIVLGDIAKVEPDTRKTFVIIATDGPLSMSDLTPITATNPDWASAAVEMKPFRLNSYLRQEPPIILTDDYVPTDNLLAPVFGGGQ